MILSLEATATKTKETHDVLFYMSERRQISVANIRASYIQNYTMRACYGNCLQLSINIGNNLRSWSTLTYVYSIILNVDIFN